MPVIHRTLHKKYPDIIKKANRDLATEKPWIKGLYEAIIAVNELPRLKLEQNNRISLLILDNTLEIAFKEYLVNESGAPYAEDRLSEIMKTRPKVHAEIKKYIKLSDKIWRKIEYFYKLRSELMHKRVVVNISDDDLQNYRQTVEFVLKKLFKISF